MKTATTHQHAYVSAMKAATRNRFNYWVMICKNEGKRIDSKTGVDLSYCDVIYNKRFTTNKGV